MKWYGTNFKNRKPYTVYRIPRIPFIQFVDWLDHDQIWHDLTPTHFYGLLLTAGGDVLSALVLLELSITTYVAQQQAKKKQT